MRLSVFTTITNPVRRQDPFAQAIDCYTEMADEVVVVDGDPTHSPMKNITRFNGKDIIVVESPWPKEFSWEFIGQQFQRGYEAATGDWVIHADIDFFFHERIFGVLRRRLQSITGPAAHFYKWQFILPDRYNVKSRLVIAVNKGVYGDRIRFDSGGDLCQPSLDGVELKPDQVPETGLAIYNYEKMLKTQEQIKEDVGRMARAWKRYWHENKLGDDDESAYYKWLTMATGRLRKPQRRIRLGEHPKYIQETIRHLKRNQWGHSAFGIERAYA